MSWLGSHGRVDYVPQLELSECGAASLAMVLGFHGHHASLAELRQACAVSRDGASALAILQAARGHGLEARGVKLELEQLDQLPLPAILHWDFNHFLVLEKCSKRWAVLVDPACGRRRLGRAALGPHFTGAALLFAPGPAFRRRRRRWPSLAKYRELLQRSLPSLAQLLLAALAMQGVGLLFPVANQLLLDRVIVPHQPSWLWGLALGLGLAVLAKAAVGLAQGWVVQGLQVALDHRLMTGFLQHLLRLPMDFFLRREAGDLLARVQETSTLRDLLGSQAVAALLNGFLLLGYAALMLAYHPRLGMLVLGFGLARAALFLALQDRHRQLLAGELAATGRAASALLEAITGFESIKACGAEPRMVQRWGHRMTARVNAGLARQRLLLGAGAAMGLCQGAAGVAILLFGGRQVLAQHMTLGVFIAFLTLQGLFLGPLEALLGTAHQLQHLGCHLRRLDDVLETPAEPSGSEDPGRLRGAVELRQVSFSHSRGAEPVLRDLNLSIRPGEKLAIAGPTGAGKSTLARLLLGLHRPDRGSIHFDGRDLRDLDLRRLRNQLGVVLQETFLFDDSVRANLSLHDPELPLERLRWAADLACVDEVIAALPEGYDSRIGENGSLLSGGQRQRLSLARALAHDPAILLLDEATSSLDLETERRVHANLATLGCTRILIAHRPATLRDADRILMLEAGQIVQEGGYQELRQRPGPFRAMLAAMAPVHA